MKKHILLLLISSIFITSCSSDSSNKMIVNGTISGLQKGTLYLQKMQDTILTSVDSIQLIGQNTFELIDENTEIEIYYLTLKEKEKEKISFFSEKGTITINSKLDKFVTSAIITGSKAQKLLEEYKSMTDQFSGKRLDLIKETFEAQATKDDELIEKSDKNLRRLIKNRYLYSANFSIKNANSEVAPYIALTELYDAHVSLLDTVNNSLSEKIKVSKYGKRLDAFVKDIKENEK
ncbi:MAG: hypothetical protein ACI8RP_000586 [Urechidicola sp.]|jgi:hypothetical protein|tara:strand:+ start:426 stop:1127 length:702 start_codon:yes stop_codon:yes gene_type:complete